MNMQQAQAQLAQADSDITQLLLRAGEDMTQPIQSGTITPNGNNNVINVPMRTVGLTRGFILKATASFANASAGSTATLTNFGAANLISNIVLTDLDNYQRVNTTGWHLWMLNTAKEGFPFAAALVASATDDPVKTGNNYSAISGTATIASGGAGTGTVQMYYWIPCSYGKRDLRGAIYTGVVNATAFVQFTVNTTPFIPTGSDATLAVYTGGGAAGSTTITSFSYTLYQNYIDQVPRYRGGQNDGKPILPPLGIRTQYRLVSTSLSAVSANQDFPIPFTNFQSFLSASIIYDQNGTLNAGTDINQFKLAAANTLQFFYLDAITQAVRGRVRIKTDWPTGSYMFDFREQPINTNQAGNMQLLVNPSSAAANSQFLIGWEAFADVNTILGAQSLPAS